MWAIALGGEGFGNANGVAIDSNGDVIAVGTAYGPIDFGGGAMNPGAQYGFITKRDAYDGSERWTVRLGNNSWIANVGVDGDNAILVDGGLAGVVDLGGITLDAGNGATFLARYSPGGALEWARLLSVGSPSGFAVHRDGSVALAGSIADMASGTTWLASYDATGSLVWQTTVDEADVSQLASAPDGDVVVSTTSRSFGGTDTLMYRTMVTRYRSDGTRLWSHTIADGAAWVTGDGIAVTADDTTVLETQESQAGSDSGLEAHAIDANSNELWSANVAPTSVAGPVVRVLVESPNGGIVAAQWLDGPYNVGPPSAVQGQLALSHVDVGAVDTTSLSSRLVASPSQTSFNSGATGALGVAAFAGSMGGKLQVGTATASSAGPHSIFIVHMALPMQ